MPRFFISSESVEDGSFTPFPDDIKHIVNVLRMKEGELLTLCDSKGFDYKCRIKDISKNSISLELISKNKSVSEPEVKITLYQGIPKQDKMELIIQKAVELGIYRIVPVDTERAIVSLKGKEDKKISRWQKIAESASKQSGRGIVPEIAQVMTFKEAVSEASKERLSFIPYELEEEKLLSNIIRGFSGESMSYFIGPEGGFSEKEVELAREHEIIPVSLGKRILRTETAGLAVLSAIMYELGEL
ncbi:16S rRNA (uracil(1498)-N(3))-methyltransferase [Anaeropeptidivorans aminofermentans]|jgi:16S rRNA (uracil1498-N3)-methyltransferase|uniref:16S rRNA (uracil(1498)-N(3))-methyltransferase n=1 Tax=Anaeropeptidivorans aminofermentans TaxID=2934315 RepID=UPI002024BD5F|nr:16S rRNA (uracil(1498)-N(3))-methyltransferase [Anaeropeptidivorans aminofermentans]MBE6013707.1 16S rRNA (uracil(1498)-N(3))-methyltransferase [Lachnospiraceae bacterium]